MEVSLIEELKEIQKIHYEATAPMDSYMSGLYNGLELAIAVLTDTEPMFKEVAVEGSVTYDLSNIDLD